MVTYNNKNVIIKHFKQHECVNSCEVTDCWVNVAKRNKAEWKTDVYVFLPVCGRVGGLTLQGPSEWKLLYAIFHGHPIIDNTAYTCSAELLPMREITQKQLMKHASSTRAEISPQAPDLKALV